MKPISQLSKGYMLVSSDDGDKFKVKKIGYPYKDTEFSSQTMLDNLLTELRIKDRAVIQTVADLIELLEDKYKLLSTTYTRREMCQMLEWGKIDPHSSVLFECKFFSVYSISDKFNSLFYRSIHGKVEVIGDHNEYAKGLFILHWHKGVPEEDMLTSLPVKGAQSFFDTTLESKIHLQLAEFKFYMTLIYEGLDKLELNSILFSPETVFEAYAGYEICNSDGRTAGRQIKVLIDDALQQFNFFDMYMQSRSSRDPVRRIFKELYGCDLFFGLKEYVTMNFYYTFQLGLQCCLYHFLNGARKAECRDLIERLAKEIAYQQGHRFSNTYYIIKDGEIIILTSPYIGLIVDKDSILLSEENSIGIVDLADGEQMLGFSPGKDAKGVLEGLEYRLYQYFVLINSTFGTAQTVEYYPSVKFSLNDNTKKNESRGTWFSYRNALKAIVPNFDRFYLMNAYNGLPMIDVAEQYYNLYDNGTNFASYTFALDYALGDAFTVEEKSFILMLGRLNMRIGMYLTTEDLGQLCPVVSDDFAKKLEVVFKLGSLVSLCATKLNLVTMLRESNFTYKYEDYNFTFRWER